MRKTNEDKKIQLDTESNKNDEQTETSEFGLNNVATFLFNHFSILHYVSLFCKIECKEYT